MKTTAAVLITAVLASGTTYAVQQARREDPWPPKANGEAARELRYTELLLEDARADAGELERRVRFLRSEVSRLEAELEEPGLTPTDAPLADGRHAVFLDGIDDDSLVVDVIQWLSGEEANRAAVEDGAIEEGDTVPNDYYIRNQNPQLRALEIVPGLKVELSTWMCGGDIPNTKFVSFIHFVGVFNDPGRCAHNVVQSPYWITVHEGVVVAMEEQYRP